MPGCGANLHARLPARPDSIARLRRAVVDFAEGNGVSARQREDIALAVSEAVSNAVLHAYAGRDGPGDVAVEAWAADGALEVVVCDDGVGLRPRAHGSEMRLGLALIGQLASRLALETAGPLPGLRVRMTFAID
ncbi:MAG: ATP-binding protein [Solirubrobacteraceae bacterium]